MAGAKLIPNLWQTGTKRGKRKWTVPGGKHFSDQTSTWPRSFWNKAKISCKDWSFHSTSDFGYLPKNLWSTNLLTSITLLCWMQKIKSCNVFQEKGSLISASSIYSLNMGAYPGYDPANCSWRLPFFCLPFPKQLNHSCFFPAFLPIQVFPFLWYSTRFYNLHYIQVETVMFSDWILKKYETPLFDKASMSSLKEFES